MHKRGEIKLDQVRELKQGLSLPSGFSAGFARETVNPLPGTSLGGYGTADRRLSDRVLDDICVSCTALSDGEKVFLFYSTDSLYVRNTMLDQVTETLKAELGIEKEHVVMNATHSHAAPIIHYPGMPGMPEYMSRFLPAVYRVAREAIADLECAELYAGETETEGLNYVRRYVSIDGKTYIGNWLKYGQNPAEVRHETEADHQLQTLRFARKTKKDIVMVNWQCHPCSRGIGGEFSTDVSSDWVAPMRETLEQDLNVHAVYHQGAAGNVVSTTCIAGEKNNLDYRVKGKELAEEVKKALSKEKALKTGRFHAERRNFVAVHDEKWKEAHRVTEPTDTLYLSVLSIGDVAFATAPCEWHDTCGRMVKDNSPFATTFVCAYSNGVVSYIPADFAFDLGGYEVKMCHFVRGTGEKIALDLISMLKQIQKGE